MPVYSSDRVTAYAGLGSSPLAGAIDRLTIVAPNTVNPLAAMPTTDVAFFLNGELVDGITNSNQSIAVDPDILGVNVDLTDTITAIYG